MLEQLVYKGTNSKAKPFSHRSINKGHIIFGVSRIIKVQALIYWVKYYSRVNSAPSLNGLNKQTLNKKFNTSKEIGMICRSESDTVNVQSKES